MEDRETALIEIYDRIAAARTTLGIVSFKRAPATPLDPDKLPCITMIEGIDEIIKVNSRGTSIYPARRVVQVVLELSTSDDVDIKALYRSVRTTVLGNSQVAPNTYISEIRTEGPAGYEIPNTQGMRLDMLPSFCVFNPFMGGQFFGN